MRVGLFVVLAIGLASVLGCSRQASAPPRHIVFLVDVSASIEKSAEQEAFQAIAEVIATTRRGDLVSVIPITGDAESEVQGTILRLRPQARREAYDQDRKRFEELVRRSLEEAKVAALAHPGQKTDILGTIDIAAQEYALDGLGTERDLAIFSDFIQDDERMNFTTACALRDADSAKALATQLAQSRQLPQPVHVFLGSLRSTDLKHLDRERRAAIKEFWRAYFAENSSEPTFAVDGPNLIVRLLR